MREEWVSDRDSQVEETSEWVSEWVSVDKQMIIRYQF